ncbi:unnamed protein product [Microthlaspi erraticum]|uniref:Uncharacterized protein n=1 Tax=Microthlaspi erraticum TaxID=1685480 RepID=A0A6D2HLR1_9BRAS|nr:unnamed protein product [Microthlaspi erraticum]
MTTGNISLRVGVPISSRICLALLLNSHVFDHVTFEHQAHNSPRSFLLTSLRGVKCFTKIGVSVSLSVVNFQSD